MSEEKINSKEEKVEDVNKQKNINTQNQAKKSTKKIKKNDIMT